MPRRNYKSRARRPSARPLDLEFADRLARPRQTATSPPVDVAGYVHRPNCARPDVVTFVGKFGDRMARCRTCNTLNQLNSTERNT